MLSKNARAAANILGASVGAAVFLVLALVSFMMGAVSGGTGDGHGGSAFYFIAAVLVFGAIATLVACGVAIVRIRREGTERERAPLPLAAADATREHTLDLVLRALGLGVGGVALLLRFVPASGRGPLFVSLLTAFALAVSVIDALVRRDIASDARGFYAVGIVASGVVTGPLVAIIYLLAGRKRTRELARRFGHAVASRPPL